MEVTLNETETRYYSDLFVCCDVEKTGKIATLKATELFRSANIPDSVIHEITSLSGIPDTALHISRAQFYSCLKLIAAYQAAVPLRQELIVSSVQLPLPRFSWKESPSNIENAMNSASSMNHQSNGINPILPAPPNDRKNSLTRRNIDWPENATTTGSRRNSAVHQRQEADVPSTDSEVEQNESSGAAGTGSSSREHRRRGSPEAWSTNSDSPTPTNSVAEQRPWAKETLWQGLGDEHRQLLGTEEESSDRHSSDEDNEETDLETVYQITPEQREYYFKQFKAVQHDPSGLLSGQVARVFFEKSRIPVEELRHIWQLCDVTRDGALSLAEFTAAMHLVVLRRNNIPLPALLPACLHPKVLQHSTLATHQQQEPPEADLLHLNDDDDEEDNTDNTIVGGNAAAVAGTRVSNDKNIMNMSTLSTSSQTSTNSRQGIGPMTNHMNLTSPPLPPPPVKNRSISNSPNAEPNTTPPNLANATAGGAASGNGGGATAAGKSKDRSLWAADAPPPTQWTKFTESPTSNVSSPGPKPVNFDMQRTVQAVVSDPQILHPVALRVTPVAGSASSTNTVELSNSDESSTGTQRDTSPKQLAATNATSTTAPATVATTSGQRDSTMQSNDLRAIQRPQAKKLPAKNIGALPPPPQRESSIGGVGSSNAIAIGNGDGDTSSNGQQQAGGLSNKKDAPPLPPPRPHRHGRSSSLDLNKFKIPGAPGGQQNEITAQASFDLQTSTGFADFTNFPDGSATNVNDQLSEQQQHSLPPQTAAPSMPPPQAVLQSTQRISAFEVYRKPNTPRSSQSPPATATAMEHATNSGQLSFVQSQIPFGAGAAVAAAATALTNTDAYEKRVYAISESLKHVSFKQDNNTMPDVLRYLREQNNLLLRLCNDLSDELLTVQTRKEEMRLKLEAAASEMAASAATALTANSISQATRTGSSISAPVTANVTGGSGSSGMHSNV